MNLSEVSICGAYSNLFQLSLVDAPFLSLHRLPRVASFLLTRGYLDFTPSGQLLNNNIVQSNIFYHCSLRSSRLCATLFLGSRKDAKHAKWFTISISQYHYSLRSSRLCATLFLGSRKDAKHAKWFTISISLSHCSLRSSRLCATLFLGSRNDAKHAKWFTISISLSHCSLRSSRLCATLFLGSRKDAKHAK